jgi:hypothetical protein
MLLFAILALSEAIFIGKLIRKILITHQKVYFIEFLISYILLITLSLMAVFIL